MFGIKNPFVNPLKLHYFYTVFLFHDLSRLNIEKTLCGFHLKILIIFYYLQTENKTLKHKTKNIKTKTSNYQIIKISKPINKHCQKNKVIFPARSKII